MKAMLVHRSKVQDEHGNTVEIKVWRVPATEHTPFGFKYSFVYIAGGERVIGYDNERGKGHHRHVGGEELPYAFKDIPTLTSDFLTEVAAFKRSTYG